jgi:hypothetical protein
MSTEPVPINLDADSQKLEKSLRAPKYEKHARFVVAALSSIPWVGGMIGAGAALHAEAEQGRANELICRWLEEHRKKINELATTLEEIVNRVEQVGQEAQARLDDDPYLSLVRQGFRVWDSANTASKRDFVRRTLTNAAASTICSDDLVRLFLDWIERYDETHFKIIRVLFQNRGATRGRIWDEIGSEDVREDSAEADLFKLLIFDLSTGHVLRQIRQTNDQGQFLAKRRTRRTGMRTTTLESAFEDTKPYELTAMGEQFATYVLNETVPRLS